MAIVKTDGKWTTVKVVNQLLNTCEMKYLFIYSFFSLRCSILMNMNI